MSGDQPNGPLRIDVDAVMRSRLPRHYRYIPRFLIKWVERVICQNQLNEMLEVNHGKRGAAFARGVLEHLNISVDYHGVEHLDPSDPRVIIVSNHPLGGLDGMALIEMVERHYGVAPRFVVNDLLMAVEPLTDVFVPINKHGRQSRQSSEALDDALRGDAPVIIFPAGLVSRRQKGGRIADLMWRKMFVNKSREYGRKIIPAYFSGRNSNFFYNFAKLRTRIGLRFNIEMIYLPREVFRNRDAHFDVYFAPATDEALTAKGRDVAAVADAIRERVYSLAPEGTVD